MADPPPGDPPPRRPRWPLMVTLLALAGLLLLALAGAGLWALSETAKGRAFVVRTLLPHLVLENGVAVAVGRIDGSLLRAPRLRDVVVTDQDGVFATAPALAIDWSARALLGGRIHLRWLEAEEVRLWRRPRLIPPPPDAPLLPDITVAIDRFDVARLVVDDEVAGVAETVALAGRIALADRIAFVALEAAATKGDRLRLLVDAAPDSDRLDLEGQLVGMPGGLVTAALGLAEPVRLDLSGVGGWTRWRGVLNTRIGEVPAATLGISADDGRFALSGTIRPGPVLPDILAGRLGQAFEVEARAVPEGRQTRIALDLRGDGLSLVAGGLLDRQSERIADGRLRLDVVDPGRLQLGLAGAPVRLDVRLAGPLRAPEGSWSVRAARLVQGAGDEAVGAEGLEAEGKLAWTGRRLKAPFTARARRLTGLPPEIADLLARPELTGTLQQTAGGYAADDLRLRAAGATGAGVASFARQIGRWQLEATATVPRLALGADVRVAAVARARLAPDSKGALAARGLLELRAVALGDGLRRQLGGLPTARLPFTFSGGQLRVQDGSFAAPDLSLGAVGLQLDSGSGRFALAGAGTSRFGPLALRANGTLAAPRLQVQLAAPGFGLGLAELRLEAVPVAGGFAITASGRTPQGPLAIAGRVELAAAGPLAIDVADASLSGIRASGRLVQTAAGPFAGRLGVTGSGLDGTLDFSAVGAAQRITATGTAAQARLPLAEPVIIGAGTVEATLLLTADGPRLSGTIAARNLVRAGLRLSEFSAQGVASEAGGEGRVSGSGLWRGRMLRGQATIRQDSLGLLVGLDGRYGALPFRLLEPARIRRLPKGWELVRARLALPTGSIDLAGQFGAGGRLRVAVDGVDLDATRLADSRLAVRGRVDGYVDLALGPGETWPAGRVQLRLRGFSRPSAVSDVPRIDVDLEASSTREGLVAGARLTGSRGSSGRLLLRLVPGGGKSFADRLLAGAISGGLRYAGPAETVWSFLDIPDQELSGPVGLALDVTGTVAAPRIEGGVRGKGLAYRNLGFGTRLTNLDIEGTFEGSRLVISRISADANGGNIRGQGSIRLEAEGGGQLDLAFRLEKALLADSPTIRIIASGPLALKGTLARSTLSGVLEVTQGRFRLGQTQATAAANVPVRRKSESAAPALAREAGSLVRFDVEVLARDSVKVDGLGLESFWGSRVRIGGDARNPRLSGEAVLARGSYDFAGRTFEIGRGRIGFTGAPLDSTLDIQAKSRAEGFEAGVRISGTARRPEIGFTSSPPLPEDEVLARLLFGTSVADLSVTEAVQLATALAALRGGSGGFDPVGQLQRASGIDRIRLQGSDTATGLGTAIAFGERIGRNLYVEVATDTSGNALTTLEFAINRVLGLLAQVTTLGNASVNLRYSRDY
ncbi:translocation/assembly module TamB domain-containing protein [Thermaurantiacus sp.]